MSFLAQVMTRSAILAAAFAFASVVRICSCSISCETSVRNTASRCVGFREKVLIRILAVSCPCGTCELLRQSWIVLELHHRQVKRTFEEDEVES